MLNITGILNNDGEIVLQNGRTVKWKTLGEEKSPKLPAGINVELTVSIDENSLTSGRHGFVWATTNVQQAEIISNALKVQKFESEIVNIELDKKVIYLIKVTREEDVKEVIDFIQNDASGLRLIPDWNYPSGEPNQSFELWINE